MKKKIKSLYFTLLLIFINFQNAYATTIKDFPGTLPAGEATEGIKNLGGKAITLVSTIGSMISIVVLIILGIKYMMGSVEEKAEYKKTLFPYFIGAILVFAASSIAQMSYKIVGNLL